VNTTDAVIIENTDEFNFYESLNLLDNERLNLDLIIENFKKLSIVNHPDKFVDDYEQAKHRFSYLCLSYYVLSDKSLKNSYDKYLKSELSENEIEKMKSEIDVLWEKAKQIADLKFKDFIFILKNEYNIISDMTAQTAVGMYYEALDLRNEKHSFELFLDPEDIKPKVSLLIESAIGFGVATGIITLIFFTFYIIALIKL